MTHHSPQLAEQIPTYDQIYISPHLDDAVLSCGGTIATHAANQQRMLVVTVCTGTPPADVQRSPFVAHIHALWQLEAEEVMQTRRQEDRQALAQLGADIHWLGLLDAIYREPEAYTDNTRLFGRIAPADTLGVAVAATLDELLRQQPQATLHAPLGVGGHVDHQIVYQAAVDLARAGAAVAFYEDFPYVQVADALDARLRYLAEQGDTFSPRTLIIDATLTRKIRAIAAYASQLAAVFAEAGPMPEVVTRYARSLHPEAGNYGERIWLLDNPVSSGR
ncbi:MAG: PIG-L deacetylase family protein [Chloroflexaceae bacterium]